MGEAEIEIADLHAAEPPHHAAAVQNGYAQQRDLLPCIQQLRALRPQATVCQPLSLIGGDLLTAGDQRGVQLRVPAVVHLELQAPRRLRSAPEADDVLLRGHRGLEPGIPQIHTCPQIVRVGQGCVGGGVQAEEDPAARGGAQRTAQRRVQPLFQLRDGGRVVVQLVKGDALDREEGVQLLAQLFRHGHSLRRQRIHLRIQRGVGVPLLDIQYPRQLPGGVGQHTGGHEDRQDGRHQQQRHGKPVQQQPHPHAGGGGMTRPMEHFPDRPHVLSLSHVP